MADKFTINTRRLRVRRPRRVPRCNRARCGAAAIGERGFSFIELIIALAITAVLMAAFLQTTQGLFAATSRASAVAQNALERSVRLGQFQSAVGGLVPAWPEEDEAVFSGDRTGFSGLTRSALHNDAPGLSAIAFELRRSGDGTDLHYVSGDVSWRLARFAAGPASFSYLGADQSWYDIWPPEENPPPGPLDDHEFYPTPQLPLAVRLQAADGVYYAAMQWPPRLPLRPEDALGE